MIQTKLEDVDDVTRAGKPLRRAQRHETPVLVVVIKAGIENSRDTKPPRPRRGKSPGFRRRCVAALRRSFAPARDRRPLSPLLALARRRKAAPSGRPPA